MRTSTAWPAVILVATALAFLPMQFLPSFDVPKLAVLVIGALVLVAVVTKRRDGAARDGVLVDPILAIPLAMTAVALVGAVWVWPRGSLFGPATAVACIALARLAAQSEDPRGAVRMFARGAAVAAAVGGAYGLCQWSGHDFTPWAARREPVATFGNTSFAAEFQAAALPLALLLALRRDATRFDRVLGGVGALLSATHLLLGIAIQRLHLPLPEFPTSRTDVAAAAAGLLVGASLLLAGRGRVRTASALAWIGGGALVVVAVLFVVAPETLGRADTIEVRKSVWPATARMIADEPFHVAGRSFIDRFPEWRGADEYRISFGRRVETPHDDFLELAVALGIPGLLAALAVVVALARRVVAASKEHAAECAALGASLAAVAASALASSPLSHPATTLLFASAAGLVVALAPRPWRGFAPRARTTDVAFAVALVLAVWPGPAWRGLRSDGFLALGRDAVARGDSKRALLLLDEAAAVDPQAFDARFELGGILSSAGQRDAAIAALESARALRPGDLECRVNLAYALRDAGRRDEAKKIVDESLARCPWHPMSLAARAIFALEDGRADDALADAKRAAAGLPTDPRLAALAAQARLAVEASEDAYAEALDALVRLFDDRQTAEFGRFTRAMLRLDRGFAGPLVTRARRLAAARPDAAAALALAGASGVKDDAGFLDDAAQVLRQTGRVDESREVLGRALGVRAEQAYARGEDDKAIKFAHQAADRDPRPSHYLLAARAAARLGERDAVVEEIGAAIASGPVAPDDIRQDPVLSKLLPDARIEDLVESAARRSGENRGKAPPR